MFVALFVGSSTTLKQTFGGTRNRAHKSSAKPLTFRHGVLRSSSDVQRRSADRQLVRRTKRHVRVADGRQQGLGLSERLPTTRHARQRRQTHATNEGKGVGNTRVLIYSVLPMSAQYVNYLEKYSP